MNQKGPEILIISGTLGLGHITRDLEIAKEIRKEIPQAKISWISAPPASNYLIENNETLLPESEYWPSETDVAEKTSVGSEMNIAYYFINASETWDKQWEIFNKVVKKYSFDLIIGDETYRIATNLSDAALNNQPIIQTPFVIIYDFVGAKAMTNDPREKEVVDYMNNLWQIRVSSKFPEELPQHLITRFFVGEVNDIENRETDHGIIDFKNLVKDSMTFLGNIIRFDPNEYRDKSFFREKLGYSPNPLIVCNIGGSNIGSELLQLCGASYKFLEKKLPGLQMVLACGPRIDPDTLDLPQGIIAHGYMPELIEHFAACDLAVIQPGLSTVNELVSLQKPFIYFPIPNHFEQNDISNRLKRRQIGMEMLLEETTPKILGDAIMSNIGDTVNYPKMNYQGAKNAAKHIKKIISSIKPQNS